MKSQLNFRRAACFSTLIISLGSVFSQNAMADPSASLQGVTHSNDEEEEEEQKESSSAPSQSQSQSSVQAATDLNTVVHYKNLTLPQVLPSLKFPNGDRIDYDEVTRFPIYQCLGLQSSLISFPGKADFSDILKSLPFYSVIEFRNILKRITEPQMDDIPDPELVILHQQFEENRNRLAQDPLTSSKVSEIEELEGKIKSSVPIVQRDRLNSVYITLRYELERLNSYALYVCNENNPCARLKRLIAALENIQTETIAHKNTQTEIIEELGETVLSSLNLGSDPTSSLSGLKKSHRKLLTALLNGSTETEIQPVHSFGSGYRTVSDGPQHPFYALFNEVDTLSDNIADHEKLLKKALEIQDPPRFSNVFFLNKYQELFETKPMPSRLLDPFLQLILREKEYNRKVRLLIFFDRQIIN